MSMTSAPVSMTSAPAKSQELQQPTQPTLDENKAEAFAQKMLNILNSAGVALMVSIGHRTGLLEVMSKILPSTSADISRSAALNERYVREWLGAMVTGGIVEFDPLTQAYRLPPEHSAFLTPAASPNNLAVTVPVHLGAWRSRGSNYRLFPPWWGSPLFCVRAIPRSNGRRERSNHGGGSAGCDSPSGPYS